jgi:hypothetical protein
MEMKKAWKLLGGTALVLSLTCINGSVCGLLGTTVNKKMNIEHFGKGEDSGWNFDARYEESCSLERIAADAYAWYYIAHGLYAYAVSRLGLAWKGGNATEIGRARDNLVALVNIVAGKEGLMEFLMSTSGSMDIEMGLNDMEINELASGTKCMGQVYVRKLRGDARDLGKMVRRMILETAANARTWGVEQVVERKWVVLLWDALTMAIEENSKFKSTDGVAQWLRERTGANEQGDGPVWEYAVLKLARLSYYYNVGIPDWVPNRMVERIKRESYGRKLEKLLLDEVRMESNRTGLGEKGLGIALENSWKNLEGLLGKDETSGKNAEEQLRKGLEDALRSDYGEMYYKYVTELMNVQSKSRDNVGLKAARKWAIEAKRKYCKIAVLEWKLGFVGKIKDNGADWLQNMGGLWVGNDAHVLVEKLKQGLKEKMKKRREENGIDKMEHEKKMKEEMEKLEVAVLGGIKKAEKQLGVELEGHLTGIAALKTMYDAVRDGWKKLLSKEWDGEKAGEGKKSGKDELEKHIYGVGGEKLKEIVLTLKKYGDWVDEEGKHQRELEWAKLEEAMIETVNVGDGIKMVIEEIAEEELDSESRSNKLGNSSSSGGDTVKEYWLSWDELKTEVVEAKNVLKGIKAERENKREAEKIEKKQEKDEAERDAVWDGNMKKKRANDEKLKFKGSEEDNTRWMEKLVKYYKEWEKADYTESRVSGEEKAREIATLLLGGDVAGAKDKMGELVKDPCGRKTGARLVNALVYPVAGLIKDTLKKSDHGRDSEIREEDLGLGLGEGARVIDLYMRFGGESGWTDMIDTVAAGAVNMMRENGDWKKRELQMDVDMMWWIYSYLRGDLVTQGYREKRNRSVEGEVIWKMKDFRMANTLVELSEKNEVYIPVVVDKKGLVEPVRDYLIENFGEDRGLAVVTKKEDWERLERLAKACGKGGDKEDGLIAILNSENWGDNATAAIVTKQPGEVIVTKQPGEVIFGKEKSLYRLLCRIGKKNMQEWVTEVLDAGE